MVYYKLECIKICEEKETHMLNAEKIRLMTDLAIYEKKNDEKVFKINDYYKGDYISGHLIWAFIRYSLCFAFMLVAAFFLDFAGINSIDELPVSDVLSPGQISEWIKRASNPENINDSDVGLPKSSSNSELNLNLDGENLAKDDVLREDYVENPNSFPSSGAETAGSIEEFELSRDNQSGNDTNKAEI